MRTHIDLTSVPAAQLQVMPLHAITELHGPVGLHERLILDLRRLAGADRRLVAGAAAWAGQLHAAQRRTREPYVSHVLRVTLRILCYYQVHDPEVLVAALLHDTVEDQPWAMAGLPVGPGPPPREQALAVLTKRHGRRVARLVNAVTNQPDRPEIDRIQQYVKHLATALDDEPWARVIKLSDFTDNGCGISYAIGPKVHHLARKYTPAVPVLRDLLARPDTPLHPDVKVHIHQQLDLAQQRFAAVLAA
jgi:(p)ppGpp synthase/HD superfamily hydrolase